MANLTSTDGEEAILRGYSGRLLQLILAGTLTTFVGRNIFGPLLPSIIDDLAVTSGEAGVALTVMWISIGATQYPGGLLAEQLSYKTVLVGSMAVLCAGFGVLIGTGTYLGFLLGLVVMGLGAGMFTPSSYAQIADLFEARRGQAFGLYTSSVDVGTALAGGLATVVLGLSAWRVATYTAEPTWRVAFVPVVVVLATVALAMHVFHRGAYDLDVSGCTVDLRGTLARVLRDPHVRWCVVAYVMVSFVFQGVLGFLPAFLSTGKGFSTTFANNAFVGFFLVGAVARNVVGYLGDRFTHLGVAIASAVWGAIGLGVLYTSQSIGPVVAGLGILAVGVTGFSPVMNAYLMNYFPDASMGSDYGATRTLLIFLGSLGPTYIGFLAGTFRYELAFVALVPFFLASALILLWLRRW